MSRVFTTITAEEFDAFAEKSPISHFQQHSTWANLKTTNGWIPYYIGVKEGTELIAASLVLKKPLPLKRSMLYAPRGPLLDYNNKSLLTFFFDNLKKFAKSHHAIFFKFDPEIINIERDGEGAPIKGGEDNQKIIENLKKLGIKHRGFRLNNNIAPQYTVTLNLKDKTEKELFDGMKITNRTCIRNNQKNHVTVRKITYDELPKFSKIMAHTAERRGFIDRPLSYYQEMWKALGDQMEIYISEVDLNQYLSVLNDELASLNTQKAKLTDASKTTSHQEKQIQTLNKSIAEIEAHIQKTKSTLKKADKNGILTLGGLMFMYTNREVTSLYGGNYGDYREFNSAYSLNWEMIKQSLKKGYPKYNFYGISEFKDKSNPDYGVYAFKKRFGGQLEEYIGEFDLVVSKFWYFLYHNIYELPRIIRREKNEKAAYKK